MIHGKIKNYFSEAVNSVASDISHYAMNPDKDLTRRKKLPPEKLISFMVSCGSSGTKAELLDFFNLDAESPSASAFNQQRAKLRPEALEAVFRQFNSSVQNGESRSGYRYFAADLAPSVQWLTVTLRRLGRKMFL